jgi:hypothetical protein
MIPIPILSSIMDIGAKLIDRIVPDPAAKAAAQLELIKLTQSADLQTIAGQMQVNAIEAASPNWFVSGWRPAAGWICVAGIGVQFVIGPIFTWLTALFGHMIPFPVMDLTMLLPMLASMLGLVGARSFEKVNGIAAK